MFAPFAPFIVVFCHVIAAKDTTDLARLEAFLKSIRLAQDFSEAAARLNRLFEVLYNVALRYTEMQQNSQREEQLKAAEEMDKYLAALGFPLPGLGHNINESGDIVKDGQGFTGDDDLLQDLPQLSPTMWMGNISQMENWFYNHD